MAGKVKGKIPWGLIIIDAVVWFIAILGKSINTLLSSTLGKIPILGYLFKAIGWIFSTVGGIFWFIAVGILILILIKVFAPLIKKMISKIKSKKGMIGTSRIEQVQNIATDDISHNEALITNNKRPDVCDVDSFRG